MHRPELCCLYTAKGTFSRLAVLDKPTRPLLMAKCKAPVVERTCGTPLALLSPNSSWLALNLRSLTVHTPSEIIENVIKESDKYPINAYSERQMSKQRRPWSDAAERGVWSGSIPFASYQAVLKHWCNRRFYSLFFQFIHFSYHKKQFQSDAWKR